MVSGRREHAERFLLASRHRDTRSHQAQFDLIVAWHGAPARQTLVMMGLNGDGAPPKTADRR